MDQIEHRRMSVPRRRFLAKAVMAAAAGPLLLASVTPGTLLAKSGSDGSSESSDESDSANESSSPSVVSLPGALGVASESSASSEPSEESLSSDDEASDLSDVSDSANGETTSGVSASHSGKSFSFKTGDLIIGEGAGSSVFIIDGGVRRLLTFAAFVQILVTRDFELEIIDSDVLGLITLGDPFPTHPSAEFDAALTDIAARREADEELRVHLGSGADASTTDSDLSDDLTPDLSDVSEDDDAEASSPSEPSNPGGVANNGATSGTNGPPGDDGTTGTS